MRLEQLEALEEAKKMAGLTELSEQTKGTHAAMLKVFDASGNMDTVADMENGLPIQPVEMPNFDNVYRIENGMEPLPVEMEVIESAA